LGHALVAAFVRFDFVAPEFRVRAGQVFARAAMPETAVHENRKATAGPREIRLPRDRPVLSIASEARCPQKLSKGQLGRGVAPRVNGRHDFRPNFFRDVVHKAPLQFYRFP